MSLINCNNQNANAVREQLNEEVFWAPFFGGFNRSVENFFPAFDVTEEAGQYLIKMDLPGLTKDDVQISFDNGILTIEGERKVEAEQKEKKYHRIERSYGQFARSVNLGLGIDAQNIKANYKDGVLTITVPKSERAKPKTIDINVG